MKHWIHIGESSRWSESARCLIAIIVTCLSLASVANLAAAQATAPQTPATTTPAVQPPGASAPPRQFNSKQLATRPYSPSIPAPLYPSTQRKQQQFTVQYVYNYAQSNYTPPVTLPMVSRAAAKRDSPEAALIAFYSAMRSGDYEGWLQCWDEPSRKALQEQTKQQKAGAEYWRSLWREVFAGKRFVLNDRIETVNYIILDVRIEDPAKPSAVQTDPEVLANKNGLWLLTNAFTNDGLVMNYDPASNKVVKEYEIAPIKGLVGPAALSGSAQQEFFAHHTASASVTRTVE